APRLREARARFGPAPDRLLREPAPVGALGVRPVVRLAPADRLERALGIARGEARLREPREHRAVRVLLVDRRGLRERGRGLARTARAEERASEPVPPFRDGGFAPDRVLERRD